PLWPVDPAVSRSVLVKRPQLIRGVVPRGVEHPGRMGRRDVGEDKLRAFRWSGSLRGKGLKAGANPPALHRRGEVRRQERDDVGCAGPPQQADLELVQPDWLD